jgi:hypothetical protein
MGIKTILIDGSVLMHQSIGKYPEECLEGSSKWGFIESCLSDIYVLSAWGFEIKVMFDGIVDEDGV